MGSARQVTTLGAEALQKLAPGTTVLKALNRLPGVNFQSADPFGAYQWSVSLYMRGFNQSQLGFTLDDIPLGDQGFMNWNGLPQASAVITESVSRASVSQGAGSLGVASVSALGGAIQMYTADPAEKAGGTVQQTFGSNNTFRTYARVDSGILNRTGTRFTTGYTHTTLDKWKGVGGNEGDQINFKLLQPIAERSRISTYFNWSNTRQVDYQDLSLNYWNVLGQRVDNYAPDYAAAYQAALGNFSHGEQQTNDPTDVSYYAGGDRQQAFLAGTTFDLQLTDRLRSKTVVYGSGTTNDSYWWNPYQSSPNGAPLIERSVDEGTQRYGFTSALTYKFNRHTINGGVWYENTAYSVKRLDYEAPLLSSGITPSYTSAPNEAPFEEPWAYQFHNNTFQFHLQDTFRVTNNITLQAGFRSLYSRTYDSIQANDSSITGVSSLPYGGITAAKAFLPQFSGRWRFLPNHELFFDISENMRTYVPAGFQMGSAWSSATWSDFGSMKSLKPETDWVYELGYRYHSDYFSGLLTVYRVDFSNRLQSVSSGAIANLYSHLANVGSVQTNGVEVSGTLTPFVQARSEILRGFSLYSSLSYNRSVLQNGFTDGGTPYPTRGKVIPNMPQLMYKGSLSWQYRDFGTSMDVSYIGHRYLDYMNTAVVPHYWLTSMEAHYDLGKLGFVKNMRVQFNIYNLTNMKYIATMGESGNPAQGDYQSIMPGAPRQFFGTVRADF